ncbi:MAG: hypothetical protein UY23_C0001G0145 [Candidatus Jorgensenbacteria bacterium GW2011_GWA1_48_11]|uniref:Bis(5'-nucleosyl)-tetraphosphatase [asymmetrical] n=1 Tax=Candidatus Jorgensenbacteria bacterium GW2011_GWA1_48_11 TaxID=1618660 RepID=A0A0G1UBP2_9BACT|nr:MAG: hypothetical protein UY23_C0001G0145 [Candidatus Jorgensenbacteria bacterium GW2011_GWA1_48_11]KKW12032.1 MAG: hypothetical protein UY51_C0005G0274 [Candidatus Jorgensenbacteria bacterium GW2011_GWB1_49_9]
MTKETAAGIVIYRRTKEGPKFLLLYHGGRYWNFAKGKIEAREGSYDAAVREIKEETGLGRNELKFDPRFKVYDRFVFSREKQKVFKIVIYFLAETRQGQVRLSEEHNGYGWFLYKDAVRMLMYQNLKNNLKKAYDLIRGKSLSGDQKNPKR